MRYQRKCTPCRIGFQPGFHIEFHLTAVIVVADDFPLDSDCLVLEVDSIPPQTKYLTSSQTIVSCNIDNKLKLIVLEYFKQLQKFIAIIKGSFMSVSSRYNQLVHRECNAR